MRRWIYRPLISWAGFLILVFPAFAQNSPSNQSQTQFPQLQANPFNTGFQNSSSGVAPTMRAQTPKTVSHPRALGPASRALPKIAAPSARIIGQGASAFPASYGKPAGAFLKPLARPSSSSGGGGNSSSRAIGSATFYSQAPTSTFPSSQASARSAAPALKPSSLVTPSVSSPQKITPTYVAPNGNASGSAAPSGGLGGNPKMTPQACVATGVCK